ncbi:MAG: hypothetical protein IJ782_04200 [Prevotella sp.]|nr:hypothetical protein [Prevotella sp.]
MNYRLLYILLLPLLLIGCSGDDDTTTTHIRRTIMVYFNAENNLYSAATTDLNELVTGSDKLASDCNLLVYFDVMSNPVIYKIAKGKKEVLKTFDPDIDSSDPDNMLSVFQTMIALSPSDEYATVFWGHGDGPIIANGTNSLDLDIADNEANSYGADYNSNNENKSSNATWIDIPQLASVMKQLPKQEFIFFDACCMQSVEVAYELRNCTKYLIGATCETPSFGAPYSTTTRLFGISDAETAAKAILDDYQNNSTWKIWQEDYKINNVCMSVIKTENIEELLTATSNALQTISGTTPLELTTIFNSDEHDATSCIYYFKTNGYRYGYPILYDMNDVMLHNLTAENYSVWRNAFDKVVIYHPNTGDIRDTGNCDWFGGDSYSTFGKNLPTMSIKNFRSFYLSDETYGGVSFFMPRSEYASQTYPNMNTRMYDYEWCQKVGWKDLGW